MGAVRLGARWQSPVDIPRRWLAAVFAVSTAWAVLVAVFSSDSVHQLWGAMGACGYGVALLTILVIRHARAADLALWVSFAGALVAPLGWMAARRLEQPEVWVVARSGATLLHQGTPYADAAVLASAQDPNAYNPYLPVMALFGLPRAFFDGGLITDPRIWFGVVFIAVFWLALRVGGARDAGRWTLLAVASPVIAFELAVGGTDVPMVAFLCLGFAYLAVKRPVAAGFALGIGAAMKATAWPALLVAISLLAVRDGKRAVGSFTLTAISVLVVCVGPFVAGHPKALVVNTIMFPLGLASVTSAASSPLPGHDIAATGHFGHTVVVVLLAAAGLAVALSLVFKPPRSVPRAVWLLAGAMTLMFVLAPSTRFGYFIYPATLAIWLLVVRAGLNDRGRARPGPDEPPANPHTSLPTSPAARPAA
jgi:hypothetical protein